MRLPFICTHTLELASKTFATFSFGREATSLPPPKPTLSVVRPLSPPPQMINNKRAKPAGGGAGERSHTGPPEIGPHEIEKIRVLGDGSFGTVYQGRARSKDVAVKMLHKQDLDAKTLNAFRKEVEILSQIYHPNIVLFMGACTIPGSMCIVTELLGRDMESLLQDKNVVLPLYLRMKMAKDAALGMAWLHGADPVFIHRDLKTANLLVDVSHSVKVCDFGLSQIKQRGENLKDGQEGAKGTPLWMAPEVMMGQPFNEKADIYSFGIVLWEILTRLEPFQEFENFDEFRTAVCYQHRRPAIPEDTNAKLRKLIERCWHPNPSLRPAFSEIVECLDEVILDIAISDDYGKKLWNDCFKKKESVRWSEFKAAFMELLEWSKKHFKTDLPPLPDGATPEQLREASSKQLEDFASRSQPNYVQVAEEFHRRQAEGLPLEGPRDVYGDPKNEELNFKCLKAVLADEDQPRSVTEIGTDDAMVSMERFGKVLSWFGPLVDLHFGVIILDKIRVVLSKKWFHGNITTKDAEIILLSKGPGAYLVRFSTSAPGTYTLSKVSRDGSINHQRIIYQQLPNGQTGFQINNKLYPTLDALINGEAKELGLVAGCLGSKYSILFVDLPARGYMQTS